MSAFELRKVPMARVRKASNRETAPEPPVFLQPPTPIVDPRGDGTDEDDWSPEWTLS